MRLVLASSSLRRKDLLSWLELPFEVMETGVDEQVFEDEEPSELVARLATNKAEFAAKALREKLPFGGDDEGGLIIGADTMVFVEHQLLGKPNDREEARKMIQTLSGRTHEVWTGICMVNVDTMERRVETEMTRVSVREMTEKEIEAFLDTNEWQGKAGGYQIQETMGVYITTVEGSFTNVIGLPLLVVTEMLEDMGEVVEVDVQEVITAKTGKIS